MVWTRHCAFRLWYRNFSVEYSNLLLWHLCAMLYLKFKLIFFKYQNNNYGFLKNIHIKGLYKKRREKRNIWMENLPYVAKKNFTCASSKLNSVHNYFHHLLNGWRFTSQLYREVIHTNKCLILKQIKILWYVRPVIESLAIT